MEIRLNEPPAEVAMFDTAMRRLLRQHRPSRMPFFRTLATLPKKVATDPDYLDSLYRDYQAAMHATRAAVYYMPFLDSPEMRRRKVQIFIDDDALPDGDMHHYQLRRVFENLGVKPTLTDEAFDDAVELGQHLAPAVAYFVNLARPLYSRTLGPWCVIEGLSLDWMHALASALSVHSPAVKEEPYFADCFEAHVEERHAATSLDTCRLVLHRKPELLRQTLADASTMALALDQFWDHLDKVAHKFGDSS